MEECINTFEGLDLHYGPSDPTTTTSTSMTFERGRPGS